jgi:hypothetical protein
MAGVSRVSPVSFLKAKPKTAMRLLDTVLNMAPITRSTNLRLKQFLTPLALVSTVVPKSAAWIQAYANKRLARQIIWHNLPSKASSSAVPVA